MVLSRLFYSFVFRVFLFFEWLTSKCLTPSLLSCSSQERKEMNSRHSQGYSKKSTSQTMLQFDLCFPVSLHVNNIQAIRTSTKYVNSLCLNVVSRTEGIKLLLERDSPRHKKIKIFTLIYMEPHMPFLWGYNVHFHVQSYSQIHRNTEAPTDQIILFASKSGTSTQASLYDVRHIFRSLA